MIEKKESPLNIDHKVQILLSEHELLRKRIENIINNNYKALATSITVISTLAALGDKAKFQLIYFIIPLLFVIILSWSAYMSHLAAILGGFDRVTEDQINKLALSPLTNWSNHCPKYVHNTYVILNFYILFILTVLFITIFCLYKIYHCMQTFLSLSQTIVIIAIYVIIFAITFVLTMYPLIYLSKIQEKVYKSLTASLSGLSSSGLNYNLFNTTKETHLLKKVTYFLRPIIVILFLYLLPVILIINYNSIFEYRFIIFGALWILAILYSVFSQYSMKELGFTIINISSSLKENGIFTIISISILFSLHFFIQPNVTYRPFGGNLFLVAIYIVIFSPIQEFVFRSLLFIELKKIINNKILLILVMSNFFFIFHLIYTNNFLIFSSTLGGLFWSYSYVSNRNIYGVIFSHSIIGGTAIFLDLI